MSGTPYCPYTSDAEWSQHRVLQVIREAFEERMEAHGLSRLELAQKLFARPEDIDEFFDTDDDPAFSKIFDIAGVLSLDLHIQVMEAES